MTSCSAAARSARLRSRTPSAPRARPGSRACRSTTTSTRSHAPRVGRDADMRALLDDNGVAVAEIDGRMDWLPGDWGAPSVADFVAAAAALGARSITVLETRGRRVGTDVPLDVVVRAFAALCDRAADHGLLVHLEYFPWSGIAAFATAHEIARTAGRANGGVMVDVWHHLRGPDAGATDFAVGCASVLAVQVSDVASGAARRSARRGPAPSRAARTGCRRHGGPAPRAARAGLHRAHGGRGLLRRARPAATCGGRTPRRRCFARASSWKPVCATR